jgi:perosamine synthetase
VVSSKGPFIEEFEKSFAGYIGTRYGVSTSNGTTALHLALSALGIGKGDKVLVPSLDFISVANVVTYVGAKPVFVDIERDTFNMDTSKIEERITERTKAIIPVHFAGHPCEMDAIKNIAKKYKLIVIEDAAHALEAEYKAKKIGNISDFTSFSFYATKNITTGEGGMLTTNDDRFAERQGSSAFME